jgi:hypothetical protein
VVIEVGAFTPARASNLSRRSALDAALGEHGRRRVQDHPARNPLSYYARIANEHGLVLGYGRLIQRCPQQG